MEFSGQYLTYTEYVLLGGTLNQAPFNILEFEARRKIDVETHDRLKNSSEIPQEVKLCEYALINSIEGYINSTNNITSSGSVSSENTDGYSITYITYDKIGEVVKAKSEELDDIIRTYLLRVVYNNQHLMYCGVE